MVFNKLKVLIIGVPFMGSFVSGKETSCPARTANIEGSNSLLKIEVSSSEVLLIELPLRD